MTLPKDETKLLNKAEDLYEKAREELEPRFKLFNELEDLYWGYLENKSNPWKSKVVDPEAFEKVERMVSHLAAGKPRGTFVPREDSDNKSTEIANEFFKYQWDKPELAMNDKLENFIRTAGIFGLGFVVLTWRWERVKKQYITKEGVTEKHKQIWDDPYCTVPNIYDCFPDPSATNNAEMEYFILNWYPTFKELQSTNSTFADGSKKYINLSVLKEKIKDGKGADPSRDSHRGRVDTIQKLNKNKRFEDKILVRTMYTRDRWVSWCPDLNILIEDHPNPYEHCELPIHMYVDHAYPNQLYGRGEIQPIMSLQKGLNNVLNQRLDNIRMILSPMFKTKANSKYAETWIIQPGQKWQMDNSDDVIPFQLQDVTSASFMQTTNYFKDSIAKALGNYDVLTRNETNLNRTATDARLAASEQNARIKLKENRLDSFIRRFATQWLQLDQQFTDKERVIRVVGKDAIELFTNSDKYKETDLQSPDYGNIKKVTYKGVDVPKFKMEKGSDYGFLVIEPDDIMGQFDFIPESGSTTISDPQMEVQNLSTAIKTLQGLQQTLQMENTSVNYKPIVEKLLVKLGLKGVDQILQTMQQQ